MTFGHRQLCFSSVYIVRIVSVSGAWCKPANSDTVRDSQIKRSAYNIFIFIHHIGLLSKEYTIQYAWIIFAIFFIRW